MSSGRTGTNQYERTLATAERDAEIARYKQGRQFREVAEHFDMAVSSVHVAYNRALNAAVVPAGQEAIAAETLKLDALEEAAWAVLRANHIHVSDGRVVKDDGNLITDHKPVLMAIDRLLRVAERRSRLLGLDAPTKQTITVITEDVIDAELQRLEQEIARNGEHASPDPG